MIGPIDIEAAMIGAIGSNLLLGCIWTTLISNSIMSEQRIQPTYLFMMLILYSVRFLAPIHSILNSKFVWDILYRQINFLHNSIQESNEIVAARNIVELADKMKEFDHRLEYIDSLVKKLEANPSFFIVNIEKSILAIFSFVHIYKIICYYKISTPAQNVNNLFKNKGGRNVTFNVKKQPQKSTIGKR